MSVTATVTIELLTTTGPDVWVTIPDVLGAPGVRLRYGMGGVSMTDRVASTGTLEFTVDNSEGNSEGLVGYYTPGHANAWQYFEIGAEIRVKVVYGATTYYKWRGRIDSLDIVPGERRPGGKRVVVSCVDWMDQAARATVRGIEVLTDQRGDQIFSRIVDEMVVQPTAQVIGYSVDNYPYALDNTRDEDVAVMSEFQKLAMSGLDYIYVKGDALTGGVLRYESRMTRGTSTVSTFTLDKNNLIGMENSYSRDNVLNNIQVQIFPRRVDGAATTVLFTLENTPLIPRNTSLVLTGTYRDPESGKFARIGGESMIQPVATTDYQLSTLEEGGTGDLTGQLTVTAVYAGNSAEFTITNAGPSDGYLTLLQCRGKGIYYFQSVLFIAEDAASQALYGDHVLRLDMPYQSSVLIGQDAAQFALGLNKDAAMRVERAQFLAQDSDANMTAAILREISDRITLDETVSGQNNDYFINAVEWEINGNGMIRCSWTLTPADATNYWILDQDGFTELDETTILGYGLFAPLWQLDVSTLGSDTYVNSD